MPTPESIRLGTSYTVASYYRMVAYSYQVIDLL
jgi:hypothetical protein